MPNKIVNQCILRHILILVLFIGKISASSINLHQADYIDLSNKAILCMHQDKNGYLWVGTYDGLNLYNSKNVFVYRFDLQIEKSLSSNIIHKITPAGEDELWISTFLGLNKFSITDRVVTESYPECPEAKLLAADDQGNTCVILEDEIIRYYTPKSKQFEPLQLKGLLKNEVKAVFSENENTFRLLMEDGSMHKLLFTVANDGPEVKNTKISFHKNGILSAFYDNQTLYWADKNGWLYKRNANNKQTIFIKDISKLVARHGQLSQITSFQNDIYLAFKSNGVVKLVRNRGYQPEAVNLKTGVFSLLRDNHQNILWIGTDGQGIQMYYDKPDQFNNFTLDRLPFSMKKPVRAIYTTRNDLWLGTKGDGIVRIKGYNDLNNEEPVNKNVVSYSTDQGLSSNQVFALQKSKHHNVLWIGTEGPGLSCFSTSKDKIMTVDGTENNKIEKVHSICETNDSTLWLATAGTGIQKVRYRKVNDKIEIRSVQIFTFEKSGRICNEFHAIRHIGRSTLLIGSRGGYGLIKFNIGTNEYDFIPMNGAEYSAIGDVLSVHQSKDSIFYIGASSGLTKMQLLPDNKTLLLKQFDRKDGLANDMIHGILEDKDGCIWLSTNKGLTKYNPRNDYFHNYKQGLEVTEFSDDAYWQCPYTERLFFGGINGLVWFEPKPSQTPKYKTELSFFELKFSGESVPWSKHYNTKTQQVIIPPDVKSFSISFVAVDNYSPDNYEYSYLLAGHNQDWVKLQKDNEAAFNGLSPGHYTLNVKYNNDVFASKDNNYSISIRVLPPWYLTTGMIIIYIILSWSVLIFLFFYIRKRIQKKHLSLTKKIEEEQREKLLEAKLNFFTNVTHELCTPLTLINGVTDHIKKETENNKQLQEYTEVLNTNVTNLNDLIQEILDFRKIEDSEFGMCQIEKVSISKLIDEIAKGFTSLSVQNKIDFKVSTPETLFWHTDSAFIKKIFTNLISNAFKYCNKGGMIEIKAYIEEDQLKLLVYNTGAGIEESEIPHIFNRFRISNSAEKDTNIQAASRTGLGLSICKGLVNTLKGTIDVKSEVGKYVKFTVSLPRIKEKFSQCMDKTVKSPIETNKNEAFDELSKPKILVVDDNNDITWLIAHTLTPEFHIRQASSAKEALEMIKETTPDLIITDIIMPEMSGLEFTKQIKSENYSRNIPVVIVSAKVTQSEQAEGFKTGADAYLTKPFSPQLLKSVVHRFLINKREMKNYYQSSESIYEYSEGKLIHEEDKELMKKVVAVIKENIENESLRPAFIANQLGMNVRSFYRYFKNISSLSPSDFIKDYRLNYAATMLLTTKLTVQEIIYKTGMTNKSYFYREFAKKYNKTPREYRNQEQDVKKK